MGPFLSPSSMMSTALGLVLLFVFLPLVSSGVPPADLHGFAFEDTNGDGLYSEGELPLVGQEVILVGKGNPSPAVTDSEGHFSFTGVVSAGVQIFIALQNITFDAGDVFASIVPTADGVDLVAFPGQSTSGRPELVTDMTVLSGFYFAGVDFLVFQDSDGDGSFTEGSDSPLEGLLVNLRELDRGGGSRFMAYNETGATSADGRVDFTHLMPGLYRVELVGPIDSGYFCVTPPVFEINLSSGEWLWPISPPPPLDQYYTSETDPEQTWLILRLRVRPFLPHQAYEPLQLGKQPTG